VIKVEYQLIFNCST